MVETSDSFVLRQPYGGMNVGDREELSCNDIGSIETRRRNETNYRCIFVIYRRGVVSNLADEIS